jgi:hypothetical protein
MKKICLALLVLITSSAHAFMFEVVAVSPDNTVRSSDGGTNWLYMGSYETATTWRNRSLAEVGGDGWCGVSGLLPYSAYAISSDSVAPELRTTIGGLDPYEEIDVWVLFSTCCNNDGTIRKNNWIDAGVDDGSGLTAYSIQEGNAVRTGWITRVESNLFYEVAAGYMGTVTADDNGTISLLADSRIIAPYGSTASNGDRSIFHGYVITPEPSTLVLLGLGGVLLRKRK